MSESEECTYPACGVGAKCGRTSCIDRKRAEYGDVAPSPVVRPAPDPERDARVAARREAARRRASADLDRFIADLYGSVRDAFAESGRQLSRDMADMLRHDHRE